MPWCNQIPNLVTNWWISSCNPLQPFTGVHMWPRGPFLLFCWHLQALVAFWPHGLIPESLIRLVSASAAPYLYYQPPRHLVVASDSLNGLSRPCFKLQMTFLPRSLQENSSCVYFRFRGNPIFSLTFRERIPVLLAVLAKHHASAQVCRPIAWLDSGECTF